MELCILREKLNTQQIFETVNIIDLYVSLYVVWKLFWVHSYI